MKSKNQNILYHFAAMIIAFALIMALILIAGCGNLKYGELEWSRAGNWKGKGVYFSEDVCDPNGCSHVRIFIFGPDVNHDDMMGSIAEGMVRGLK